MSKKFILLTFFLISVFISAAQNIASPPAYIKALTGEWKGERFADGRPKVSDNLLERLKKITLEEVWAELIDLGYPDQFEGGWQTIKDTGENVMTGRQ